MVAFRKLFPVLAIAPFILAFSETANAQSQPLACIANAGVPPIVRAEGVTELTGDVVLVCTGGNPATPFLANFQLFLNTNITSRLVASDLSEALLLIDEPLVPRFNTNGTPTGDSTPLCLAPAGSNSVNTIAGIGSGSAPTCNPPGVGSGYQAGSYTAFRANTTAQQNAVVWPGVPVLPPGTTGTRTFRFTNVRANASVVGATSGLIPNQITAFISVSASQSLAINNPQQTVAYVQTGLSFDVRDCANSAAASNPSLAQCSDFNIDVFNNPNRSTATGASFGVRFREGFQTAFKPRIQDTGTNPQSESIPGVVYNTESGFVRTTASSGSDAFGIVGVANSATRVAARFRDLPAGVSVFVTVRSIGTGTGSQAVLVQTGPNGEGGTLALGTGGTTTLFPVAATTNISCGGVTEQFNGSTLNAAQVPVVNGQANAVWEVETSNPSVIDTLFFQVVIAYNSDQTVTPVIPATGQSRVGGTFAPFYAGANDVTNAAGRWSSGLPIPRFLDNVTLVSSFNIGACQTNLLFPFVSSQAGFETGIAVSNTSLDPFGGNQQSGTCTVNYYGSVAGGGTAPSPQTTNAVIPAGGQMTFTLGSGGNFGVAGVPNFQGYLFVQCQFRYAHGFAFITDGPIGQGSVAEGYLALVVDGSEGNQPRGTDFGENLGH